MPVVPLAFRVRPHALQMIVPETSG
jgi:hypothetical protein